MKIIPLTQGQFALVDDLDFEWANQWKWYAQRNPTGKFYAARREGKRILWLHRELFEASSKIQVDHKNRNRLDCQRTNLRSSTPRQNNYNVGKTKRGLTSRFKGVCRIPGSFSWRAYINRPDVKPPKQHLGCYRVEEDAARAYDAAAKKLFGEFAYLNFPHE